jgi:pyruvate carboxylase
MSATIVRPGHGRAKREEVISFCQEVAKTFKGQFGQQWKGLPYHLQLQIPGAKSRITFHMGTRFEDVHENIEAVFHLLECARLISPSPAKHLILHPAEILV